MYTSPIISQAENTSIDVDFARDVPADRMCGCLPTEPHVYQSFRSYRATGMPVYPKSEWSDRIARMDAEQGWRYRRITHPFDQDGEGTCVYNALSLGDQIVRNVQFGDHNAIQLSPVSGYRWNAPGPGSGSTVGGSIRWHESKGLLPTRNDENQARVAKGHFKHVHPNVGYRASFADGWQETAAMFRADEWFSVDSVDEWVSAILNGFVCSGGRQSHCILHCGLAMDGGRLLSIYCNSWGSWGTTLETAKGPLKSFGFDSESLIRTMVGRDAFAMRTVLRPPFMR